MPKKYDPEFAFLTLCDNIEDFVEKQVAEGFITELPAVFYTPSEYGTIRLSIGEKFASNEEDEDSE
jgi:hypothetical protein